MASEVLSVSHTAGVTNSESVLLNGVNGHIYFISIQYMLYSNSFATPSHHGAINFKPKMFTNTKISSESLIQKILWFNCFF